MQKNKEGSATGHMSKLILLILGAIFLYNNKTLGLIFLVPTLFVIGCYIVSIIKYRKTSYFHITHKSFRKMTKDVGAKGEYGVYKELRELEKNGARFLFNVYVPKPNGETSEIDALMINEDGVFVFESKNYRGSVSFNNVNDAQWIHNLPSVSLFGHSDYFYSPILQNAGHINALMKYLRGDYNVYSVVSFSNKCKINFNKGFMNDTFVVNKEDLKSVVKLVNVNNSKKLSQSEINRIFDCLYPLTQVKRKVKVKHILDAKKHSLSF